MLKTGKNLDDLQDSNRAQIIRHIAMHEGCSRVDLSKATGLKQASITKIVHSLMESGLVHETGFTEGLKGRRSIGLGLNCDSRLVAGVKISWERVSVRVFDLRGNALGDAVSHSYAYLDRDNARGVVDFVVRNVRRLRKEHPNIAAAGLAVPGPFHKRDGSVLIGGGDRAPREHFPFFERIRAGVGRLPLSIDHDANAGALGYWRFRTRCDTRMSLLYLLASEGVGGGVVSEGQIFTGQSGHSSELGHIIVERRGRECVCGGHGCLDAYASSIAVEKHAASLLAKHPDSLLASGSAPNILRVFDAMRLGDRLALELIRGAGRYMGLGFASLIPIFDPDLVVVGDLMAAGGEVLLEGINAALDDTLSPFYKKPAIMLADPDDDLVMLGAATIAIERAFSRPTEMLMGTSKN